MLWLPAEMMVLAKVVDLKGFTAAARALQVPKASISRAVASLESHLGVKLLERSTRRVSLTDAGRIIYTHCRRIADETDIARAAFASPAEGGALRVRADPIYGRLLVLPLVPRFLERFPDIPLQIDLLSENDPCDVEVCGTAPPADGRSVTALGKPPMILCASASYLRSAGTPISPAELGSHPLLLATPATSPCQIVLHSGRAATQVTCTLRLAVQDPAAVHSATAAGLGIGVLPEFLCRQGLAMGRLTRVLPEWQAAAQVELFACCEVRRSQEPALRAFIAFLAANMIPALAQPTAASS
ncbi:MAG: LysR family transcriptional regulator [Steroidobacteraceae bacterium]